MSQVKFPIDHEEYVCNWLHKVWYIQILISNNCKYRIQLGLRHNKYVCNKILFGENWFSYKGDW